MIPLQRIREEPDAIREGARLKGEDAPVDEILALDDRARTLRTEVEGLRAQQRRESSTIRGAPTAEQRTALAGVKERIQSGEAELTALESRLGDLLLYVPNPPDPSVPAGGGAADNVVVRTWGTQRPAGPKTRPHHELGEALGVFDFERAGKLSGARFALLRGDGARLQRALISFFLDIATTEHGYSEVAPPYLVRRQAMIGTGQLPKFEDDAYKTDDDLFLIPTAEVPVTNLYSDEILDGERLPILHTAYTPCWRREAGAAGKDTRGYIRVHQFDKVEMVRFTTPERSLDELELLTAQAETVLQRLGLAYRVLLLCSGDMGFTQAKTYDLEVWAAGMNQWLEVSSCSLFNDFQARRAGIRYRAAAGDRPRFVHTLNGSGLAVPRTLAAILETYQQEDGSVLIPDVLRPYMVGQERIG